MNYQVVPLADGRVLGVLDSGQSAGKPIFFFAGFGVSAHAVHPDPLLARSAGARVIAVDRPAIGNSSRSARRALLDWPRDICELADRLGIDRFGILGWSGGGPHALACAYQLIERVSVTGLFSCAPPFADSDAIASLPVQVKRLAFIARHAPILVQAGCWNHCRRTKRDPDAILARSAEDLCEVDQNIIRDPRFRDALKAGMIHACIQGAGGLSDDVLVIARPWGFGLSQLRVPVHLWHGDRDKTIPIEVGWYLAKAIKDCQANFLPAGGHFSYLTHWSEILTKLVPTM
jgi:pimeloyl-ACP methyl ester carboxylesterase